MIRAHSSSGKPPTPVPKAGNASDAQPSPSATSRQLRRRPLDQPGVRAQVLPHHGAVDHVPRRGGAPRRSRPPCRPGSAPSHRLPLDLLASGPLDRARDAGAHPEVVVGRVRDRVDVERRDVSLDDFELEHGPSMPRLDLPGSSARDQERGLVGHPGQQPEVELARTRARASPSRRSGSPGGRRQGQRRDRERRRLVGVTSMPALVSTSVTSSWHEDEWLRPTSTAARA